MSRPNGKAGRYRLAGTAAIVGGALRVAIAAAFAVTGLGAAGDLPYGAFSRWIFLPTAVLSLAVTALYGSVGRTLPRRGRLGLLAAVVGLILTTAGEFGGNWLAFPRSGNLLIGPGVVLTMAGLGIFAVSARRAGMRAGLAAWALSIAVAPVLFFPLAAGIAGLAAGSFPSSLHDNYFRALYVIVASCWVLFGAAMLREARRLGE